VLFRSSLNRLKLQAGQNTPAAIKETAKQFEALFMRELLKSMREATMKSGLMDSPQENLGNDLLDQQFAVQMAGQPGPLSSGQTVVAEKANIEIRQEPGILIQLPTAPKLADVVRALNALGATPQDLLAILQAIKAAGALNAELEVI
jgi:hypothetical protein